MYSIINDILYPSDPCHLRTIQTYQHVYYTEDNQSDLYIIKIYHSHGENQQKFIIIIMLTIINTTTIITITATTSHIIILTNTIFMPTISITR